MGAPLHSRAIRQPRNRAPLLPPATSAAARSLFLLGPGFVPPEPYPPEPPGFENVWYGTPELWTFLEPNGAVWSDLPVGKGPHAVGNKTLWFSENFSTADGEDFSGNAEITLTGVNLDGSAPKVVEEGGVPSFNRYVKNFMLVGLGLPEPGCWEITATYKGAELTYALWVED